MFREILNLLRQDDLMSAALEECHEMLALCRTMVHAAVESLRSHDAAFEHVDVHALDKQVNKFERNVRRKIVTHLSLGNTADVAAGLSLVSIVIDIERIGDYSKNIVDLAQARPARLHAGAGEAEFAAIEATALQLLDGAAEVFRDGDADRARALMETYKMDVSARWRDIERGLVSGATSLDVSDAVTLALYGRFLKRISAHSRNLVSSIVNPVDRIGFKEKKPKG